MLISNRERQAQTLRREVFAGVDLGDHLSKKKCRTISAARRYFNAHPVEALDLFLRL